MEDFLNKVSNFLLFIGTIYFSIRYVSRFLPHIIKSINNIIQMKINFFLYYICIHEYFPEWFFFVFSFKISICLCDKVQGY